MRGNNYGGMLMITDLILFTCPEMSGVIRSIVVKLATRLISKIGHFEHFRKQA